MITSRSPTASPIRDLEALVGQLREAGADYPIASLEEALPL